MSEIRLAIPTSLRSDEGSYTCGVPKRPHETLIAHLEHPRPVTELRSTILASSVSSLRSRGHFDAYVALLDPAFRDAILKPNGPPWIPIEVAVAHYDACERLALGAEEMRLIGWSVGDRIHTMFMKAVAKGAQAVGVTPWTLLGNFQRLWARLLQNGSVAVLRTGPKDGIVEVQGLPLARFEYFRVGFAGVIGRAIEFGGGRGVRVSVGGFDVEKGEISIDAAWV
jgi:hypothetical protein